MSQLSNAIAALGLVALFTAPGMALAHDQSRHSGQQQWTAKQHHYAPSHRSHFDHRDRYRHAGQFHAAPLHGPAYVLVPVQPGYGRSPATVIHHGQAKRRSTGGVFYYDARRGVFIVTGSGHPTGYRY